MYEGTIIQAESIVSDSGEKIKAHIFDEIKKGAGVKDDKIELVFRGIYPSSKRVRVFYKDGLIGFADIEIFESGELKIVYTEINY